MVCHGRRIAFVLLEPVGGVGEQKRKHKPEQREGYRCIELGDAQIGNSQRDQRGHRRSERIESRRRGGQVAADVQPQRWNQCNGKGGECDEWKVDVQLWWKAHHDTHRGPEDSMRVAARRRLATNTPDCDRHDAREDRSNCG